MTNHTTLPSLIAFWIVMVCWWVFAALFLFRKKHPGSTTVKRDNRSLAGVLIVGLGYGIIWMVRRPFGTALFDAGPLIGWSVCLFTAALSSARPCMIGIARVEDSTFEDLLSRQAGVLVWLEDSSWEVWSGHHSATTKRIISGISRGR